eukprot:CAMPEP_0167795674 /NCGR_PEP_ID=MMETSP0111_2-20121227/14584_1 /TAXON_ID=91324 /ORGANISM="Lotharella globosa, Strain CCCM811" /LENGTH=196 /DNA_ID=CAMNT_0007689403 /DNA_START=58 /DNA_END=649 /DNA_ORIENTATION=+
MRRKRSHEPLCSLTAGTPISKRNRVALQILAVEPVKLPSAVNMPPIAPSQSRNCRVNSERNPTPVIPQDCNVLKPPPPMLPPVRRPTAPPVSFGAIKPKPFRAVAGDDGGLETLCGSFQGLKFTDKLKRINPENVHRPVAVHARKGAKIASSSVFATGIEAISPVSALSTVERLSISLSTLDNAESREAHLKSLDA